MQVLGSCGQHDGFIPLNQLMPYGGTNFDCHIFFVLLLFRLLLALDTI